jgi:hypothetical protein
MSKTSNLWVCRTNRKFTELYQMFSRGLFNRISGFSNKTMKSNKSNVSRIASDVLKRFVRQNFGSVEQNYEVEQIQRCPNCIIRCFPEVRSTCSRTSERTDGTVNKSEQIRFTKQEKCRKFK